MSFSQTTITAVSAPAYSFGQVYLTWTSSSPAGTWFQIYLDRALSWFGQGTAARLALPVSSVQRIDLGTVAAGEEQTDFSGSLPAAPLRRAELSWSGGTFLGSDIAGFRVYGSAAAGGAIDYAIVLADITAYPSGIYTDGWGLGGWNLGGWSNSASTYTWTSDSLSVGTWSYAILPYDAAGNLGTGATTSVVISAPPLAPAVFADALRLHYTYSSSTKEATLTWNASP